MIEILSSPILLLINSFLFGVFTKFADLPNEHGMKMASWIKILLGVLWGVFATLVIIGNSLLGTFYFAILLHWILRNKIDYLNHGIAASIILITFIWIAPNYNFNWILFIVIFTIFSFFGLLTDYDKIKKSWFTKLNAHGFIVLIFFLFISLEYWIVLASYFLNTFGYQLVKFKFEKD